MRLVSAAQATLQNMGFAVGRHPHYFSLEHHLREVLAQRGVGLVLDVGAHHGEFARTLRTHCGYDKKIVSFEPASAAFGLLQAVRDDQWERHQFALGEEDGQAELHLFGQTVLNSLLTPSTLGAAGWDMADAGSETVRVRPLDVLLPELGLDVADTATLLKIDTQGHDLAVLRGGEATVAGCVVLMTEIPVQQLYDGSPSMIETLTALGDLGFSISGLFPIGRDAELRVTEMDCVMVRAASHDGL